jgi:fructan beta-fructosidase
LGWANNWAYANDIPTYPWRGAMALPRSLSLKKTNGEWLLIQKPVDALKKLRTDPVELKNISVAGKKELSIKSQQFEMEISYQPVANSTAGVHLAVGKQNVFLIGYDASSQKLFVDRSGCINHSFNKEFASLSRYETSLTPLNGKIKLHIFFDNSIVEVFANDGMTVLTTQIFPDENDNAVELFSEGATTKFETVRLWKMRSAW